MKPWYIRIFILSICSVQYSCAQPLKSTNKPVENSAAENNKIITGAERLTTYLPLLKGKKVAVFANQTSVVAQTHLVDTLLKSGVNIVKIFGPEHGFRGNADAGEEINNSVDKKPEFPSSVFMVTIKNLPQQILKMWMYWFLTSRM